MLRITTQDDPRVLVFRLEGRLDAQSVAVLDECWRDALPSGKPRIRLDLAGVTYIDAAGKARLAELHKNNAAEFVAGNLMTKAIVAEIVGHDRSRTPGGQQRPDGHTPRAEG